MHIGIMMFSTDQTVAPAPLARMIADRGFEAMFLPEHSHIPVSRTTPYPRGGDLPPEYYRTYDMFVGLAAASVAAPDLTLGTGITVVPDLPAGSVTVRRALYAPAAVYVNVAVAVAASVVPLPSKSHA